METWQAEPGEWLTEAELMAVQTHVETKKPGNTEGPVDQGEATGTNGRDDARMPEDWGRAGATKEQG